MKQVFVVISEISKWDIELIEDDIAIGDTLHYKPFEGEEDREPVTISDGEYMWDGNKIQVDSDGKVVMINGETADVQMKKQKMDGKKKTALFAKVNDWFEKHGLKAKVVDDDDKKDDTNDDQPDQKAETIEKLRAFAKEKFGEERAEKFVDVTLADGSIAVVEPDVEVGAAIVLMDSEGNPVAAPIGEYELEDGRVIVVNEEMGAGVIAEIREAATDDEEEEEDLNKDKPPVDDQPQVKRIIDSIVSEKVFVSQGDFNGLLETVNAQKEANEALKTENAQLRENLASFQELSQEVFGKLLGEPVNPPTVPNKNPFKKEEKKNIFETPYKK